MIRALPVLVFVYLAASAVAAFVVYTNSLKAGLDATIEAGEVRLSSAISRLQGQLEGNRELVNFLAQDQHAALRIKNRDIAILNDSLSIFGLTYGVRDVDLTDETGTIFASSSPQRVGDQVSKSLIVAAMNRRLGYDQSIESDERLIRYSRVVKSSTGEALGAAVITTNVANLEFDWPVTPEPVVFFDGNGVSFSSNRPELLLLQFSFDTNQGTFPLHLKTQAVGFDVWKFTPDAEHATEVLVLQQDAPQANLSAVILLDTAEARGMALLRTWLAVALFGILGLIGAILFQQRRRLASETRHSATLETRVEERTAELKAAQDKLVEASKLAALGRLSAGVSHELNQPLAAILNFSENGRKFIEKGRKEDASENFSVIAEQVQRITRIIGNLRAFARQEAAPTGMIDLCEATQNAIDIVQADITENDVDLRLSLPEEKVWVVAGYVRIEQVIVNLISNAIDALRPQQNRNLNILLLIEGSEAKLIVRDNGPGIAEPDRVFEPFYTTKELGASKGLGMGLALSYGIIANFCGQLACQNNAVGAEFEIKLPLAKDQS